MVLRVLAICKDLAMLLLSLFSDEVRLLQDVDRVKFHIIMRV